MNKENRLTPVKLDYIKNNQQYWLFDCSCGNKKITALRHYKNNSTRSCGCLSKERPRNREYQKTSISSAWAKIRWQAKTRNHEFSLTKEEWLYLVQQNCFYCHSKPSNKCKATSGIGDFIYNGLDRQDNTKGYIKDNVVPCCYKCNSMKSNFTLEEFKKHILLLAEKFKEDTTLTLVEPA